MTLPSMIAGLDRATILEWCRRIDAGPFSSLAIGERIAFDNLDQMTTLAAAAAVTTRVRLVTTICVLPLHRAALVAKQAATLDRLSGGRLDLGLGVGGREQDYAALGAPYERRLSRLDEQVREMRRIWRGEPPVEGVAPIGPPPVQTGGPPLLAGSMGNKGIRRAARWADGIVGFSFGPDPGEVAAQFRKAEQAWKEAGRSEAPRRVTTCWYALGADGERRLHDYAVRYLEIFGREAAEGLATLATTHGDDRLRDVVSRLAEAGTDELILVPTSTEPREIDYVAELVAAHPDTDRPIR